MTTKGGNTGNPVFLAWGEGATVRLEDGREGHRREHYGLCIGETARTYIALSFVDKKVYVTKKKNARLLGDDIMKEVAKKWLLRKDDEV